MIHCRYNVKGGITNIPIHTIEKIASVLDVSPTYMVGWNTSISNGLSGEVRVLNGVERCYGSDAVNLIEMYFMLNSIGRRRVHQYMMELSEVYKDS